VPASIVSDRDSKFTSVFWHELQRLLGMKLLMSTAFHPQTDGATERANQSIGQILRMLVESNQCNWAAKCPMAEFVHSIVVAALLQALCPSS
jgi:transposase InsO family protein